MKYVYDNPSQPEVGYSLYDFYMLWLWMGEEENTWTSWNVCFQKCKEEWGRTKPAGLENLSWSNRQFTKQCWPTSKMAAGANIHGSHLKHKDKDPVALFLFPCWPFRGTTLSGSDSSFVLPEPTKNLSAMLASSRAFNQEFALWGGHGKPQR